MKLFRPRPDQQKTQNEPNNEHDPGHRIHNRILRRRNGGGPVTATTTQWPVIARPGAGLVLVSEANVGAVQRQHTFAEAFRTSWDGAEWPRGLISVTLFAGTAGDTVLTYAQWKDEDSYRALAQHLLPGRSEKIAAAVPGLQPAPPVAYRLYRERHAENGPGPECLAVVRVEFDAPDADERARRVDAVFDALEGGPEPPAGTLSGYFHVSTDGKHVPNYAEWTSEQAHRQALEASGQGTAGKGERWLAVRNFPGAVASGFRRYRLLDSYREGDQA
jgi:heme-degrading monooxygenase HmoA